MPRQTTVELIQNVPKLLSEPGQAFTGGVIQNVGDQEVWIKPTVGEGPLTPETFLDGAALLPATQGLEIVSLADLWPGMPGANRLYGMTAYRSGEVTVSHA